MNGNENGQKIGAIIGELRTERQETQQELADSIGVKRETVNQWESGTRQIKADAIIKLAKHFNVSADYLLGLVDVESPSIELQAVCKYTALSEEAINYLRDYAPLVSWGLNEFLPEFGYDFVIELYNLRQTTDEVRVELSKIRRIVDTGNIEDGEALETQLFELRKHLSVRLFEFSELCREIPDMYSAAKLQKQISKLVDDIRITVLLQDFPVDANDHGEHSEECPPAPEGQE